MDEARAAAEALVKEFPRSAKPHLGEAMRGRVLKGGTGPCVPCSTVDGDYVLFLASAPP